MGKWFLWLAMLASVSNWSHLQSHGKASAFNMQMPNLLTLSQPTLQLYNQQLLQHLLQNSARLEAQQEIAGHNEHPGFSTFPNPQPYAGIGRSDRKSSFPQISIPPNNAVRLPRIPATLNRPSETASLDLYEIPHFRKDPGLPVYNDQNSARLGSQPYIVGSGGYKLHPGIPTPLYAVPLERNSQKSGFPQIIIPPQNAIQHEKYGSPNSVVPVPLNLPLRTAETDRHPMKYLHKQPGLHEYNLQDTGIPKNLNVPLMPTKFRMYSYNQQNQGFPTNLKQHKSVEELRQNIMSTIPSLLDAQNYNSKWNLGSPWVPQLPTESAGLTVNNLHNLGVFKNSRQVLTLAEVSKNNNIQNLGFRQSLRPPSDQTGSFNIITPPILRPPFKLPEIGKYKFPLPQEHALEMTQEQRKLSLKETVGVAKVIESLLKLTPSESHENSTNRLSDFMETIGNNEKATLEKFLQWFSRDPAEINMPDLKLDQILQVMNIIQTVLDVKEEKSGMERLYLLERLTNLSSEDREALRKVLLSLRKMTKTPTSETYYGGKMYKEAPSIMIRKGAVESHNDIFYINPKPKFKDSLASLLNERFTIEDKISVTKVLHSYLEVSYSESGYDENIQQLVDLIEAITQKETISLRKYLNAMNNQLAGRTVTRGVLDVTTSEILEVIQVIQTILDVKNAEPPSVQFHIIEQLEKLTHQREYNESIKKVIGL